MLKRTLASTEVQSVLSSGSRRQSGATKSPKDGDGWDDFDVDDDEGSDVADGEADQLDRIEQILNAAKV